MRIKILFAAALALIAGACSAAGTNQSVPSTSGGPVSADSVGSDASVQSDTVAGSDSVVQPDTVDKTSMLKTLTNKVIIGSTIDPINGDQNPYGLIYLKTNPLGGGGKLAKGDLVICNFNDSANVQGKGTTIEYMTTTPGSTPQRLTQSTQLLGCASLVNNSFDEVYAADSGAKNETGVNASGKITQTLKNSTLLVEPWGSAYAPSKTGYPPGDGIFMSDASTGKIVRINLGTGGKPTYSAVISGFAVNHGVPGNILGPSGLQYNQKNDTLYIVDGVTNTVVSVAHAYNDLNAANSIVVSADGKTFTGPKAKDAKLLYSGGPLSSPVSSTLLPNGNLVIGNTGNRNGKNLMVEIASDGTFLAYRNVNTGAAGALFGIASSGTTDATTKIYFNNDNGNNVQVLEK